MLDRDRILVELDTLEGYLKELAAIAPHTFPEYRRIEKKRACERLLQISVESVIDVCHLFVRGLGLGLPAREDDVFVKLEQASVVSPGLAELLRRMKGFRNILVHEYGAVDDELVYETLLTAERDFTRFRREIADALDRLR